MASTKLAESGASHPEGAVSGLSDHDLVLQFESLGHDCELGLLQRRFGAEPLGLLRWGGTHIVHLIRALNADFAGLGDIENCSIVVGGTEYYLKDSRYGVSRHTFTTVEPGLNTDPILKRHAMLFRFLVRCLRERLAEATKIFVYKDMDKAAPHVVLELSAALRRHGPVRLLVVHEHGRSGDPVELDRLSDHAWIGRIDHFGNRNGTWDISVDHWLMLFRQMTAQEA